MFEQKDSQALAKAVERLMDEPETRQKLQEGAKKRFSEAFTAEIYARNIETIYRAVTERR